ncbi:hypothetical protein CAOG_009349 [Capsaspora owczarzaki ATCC 30864]|uniref:AAA+ ATPase domain-containing protein n=1 Tax=Capsaspora owczarzaki (strain ATCC 30864) TaxID=595528 RepID=A0A0D2WI05_CAPO3|nr:hypothetical protein CAOG_009349 [Capsaspora owczarzaki ATCC 30864]
MLLVTLVHDLKSKKTAEDAANQVARATNQAAEAIAQAKMRIAEAANQVAAANAQVATATNQAEAANTRAEQLEAKNRALETRMEELEAKGNTTFPPYGVNLTPDVDKWLLTRPELQEKILQAGDRVLVTAPPGCGKTSVLQLLQRTLKIKRQSVLSLSAWTLQSDSESPLPSEAQVLAWWQVKTSTDRPDYILVDEAQRLYGAPAFWKQVLAKGENAPKHIVFFASTQLDSAMLDTPVVRATIGWEEFRLTEMEERELCQRISSTLSFEWVKELLPRVCRDAGGHIGLFRCTIEHLLATFADHKNEATVDSVSQYYAGQMQASYFLERFFPFVVDGQPPKQKKMFLSLLRTVLQEQELDLPAPNSTRPSTPNVNPEALAQAQLKDWCLKFLLRIHVLFEPNIDDWILQVLKTFDPACLSNRSSGGTKKFPKEGVLQNQFFSGGLARLPVKYSIAAEVSNVDEGKIVIKQELDFWINSDLRWAIELMRLGNGINRHMQKLTKTYSRFKPKQSRLIDFRRAGSQPRARRNYIAVVFGSTFDTAEVRFSVEQNGKYVWSRVEVIDLVGQSRT